MSASPEHPVLAVLRDARALVARPGNTFLRSWPDAATALDELDALIAYVAAGSAIPVAAAVLFLPTGPLQELSLDSGWGEEFVALVDRFDAAVAGERP